MLDQPVAAVMKARKLLVGSPGDSVAKAAKAMARRRVGAIAIVDGDRLVGIFTERDALFRVLARGLDPRTTRVDAVMTRDPVTIGCTDPFGKALVIMNKGGFRHLPVVEAGRVVGMVSSRAALDPKLEEFRSETARRRHFTG